VACSCSSAPPWLSLCLRRRSTGLSRARTSPTPATAARAASLTQAPALAKAWRFSSGNGDFTGTPVVAEGTVMVGSFGGTVFALDAATSGLKWSRTGTTIAAGRRHRRDGASIVSAKVRVDGLQVCDPRQARACGSCATPLIDESESTTVGGRRRPEWTNCGRLGGPRSGLAQSCSCGGASTSRQLVASRRNTADSRSCRRRTQSYATRCRRDRLAPEAFTEAGAESSSGTRLGGAAVGAPSRAREWRSGVPTAPSRRPAGYWAGPWRGKTSSMLVRHWRLSSAPTDR
jgi:PQQ-like domain